MACAFPVALSSTWDLTYQNQADVGNRRLLRNNIWWWEAMPTAVFEEVGEYAVNDYSPEVLDDMVARASTLRVPAMVSPTWAGV